MSVEVQTEEIDSASAEGDELRRAGGAPGQDLRGVRWIDRDLSGLDLAGCDLSGADLSRADLSRARLIGARLNGAKLFRARLDGADLLNADMRDADLSECHGERARMGGARLAGARLFGARLDGATLTRCVLRGADLRTARLRAARLRDCDLHGCDLTRADLQGVDLAGSDVSRASFAEADLGEARLAGLIGYAASNWVGTRVDTTDFHGALMVRRTILDQNYLDEFRHQSRTHEWIYRLWWVTSDCGRSLSRWACWTALIAVVFAALFTRVEMDYGAHPTPISALYYSVVTLTTLGYGDVLPASTPAQLLAMTEVALGYLMLGGLLSIFANKMARRAD